MKKVYCFNCKWMSRGDFSNRRRCLDPETMQLFTRDSTPTHKGWTTENYPYICCERNEDYDCTGYKEKWYIRLKECLNGH